MFLNSFNVPVSPLSFVICTLAVFDSILRLSNLLYKVIVVTIKVINAVKATNIIIL